MCKTCQIVSSLCLLLFLLGSISFFHAQTPDNSQNITVPIGVHVHMYRLVDHQSLISTKDLDDIQAAGIQQVRLDLLWQVVERQKGVFNFEPYDNLLVALQHRNLRPILILGMGNPLYAADLTLQPASVQRAFERYALETVRHYQGKGITYELLNEPNHALFFKPKPDAKVYMRLVTHLVPKLKAIDPSATFIAPAASGVPETFLKTCFKKGLLSLVDGVSVHPYQSFYPEPSENQSPEMVEKEYQRLQALIKRYNTTGKKVPIYFTEWGYSTAPGQVSPQQQANYVARQALLGILYGLAGNIWYDWKGTINGPGLPDAKEAQFGIIDEKGAPKPAYQALKTLTGQLSGKTFVKRLDSAEGDYILVFQSLQEKTLVYWTVHPPHTVWVDGMLLPFRETPAYENTSSRQNSDKR